MTLMYTLVALKLDTCFLPQAAIGADGYCRRSMRPPVLSSVCLSVCFFLLSVRPERWHYRFHLSDWNSVGVCTVPRSRRLFRMTMLDQFCTFHGTLIFFWLAWTRVWGKTLSLFKGVQVSVRRLVGWCTVPWSKSPFKRAELGQFWRVPRNIEKFYDGLGSGLREDVTALARNFFCV